MKKQMKEWVQENIEPIVKLIRKAEETNNQKLIWELDYTKDMLYRNSPWSTKEWIEYWNEYIKPGIVA